MAAISYGCIGRSSSKLRTDSATGVRGSGRGARFDSARRPRDRKTGGWTILISDYSVMSIQHRVAGSMWLCAQPPTPPRQASVFGRTMPPLTLAARIRQELRVRVVGRATGPWTEVTLGHVHVPEVGETGVPRFLL